MQKSEIKSLIRELMKARNLRQSDLAEVLGVNVDRVKSITSGKVKNLTREEAEALIKKLYVRAEWLATGEGPIFQNDAEKEFNRKLQRLRAMTDQVFQMDLNSSDQVWVRNILEAVELGDEDYLMDVLRNDLTTSENRLLQNYRNCSAADQELLLRMSELSRSQNKGNDNA